MVTGSRRRGRRASSVVELIVALGIFTFGAAGAYTEYINMTRLGAQLTERTQARLLAHQRLEELLAAPYAKLAAWTPPAAPVIAANDYYELIKVTRGAGSGLDVSVMVWRSEPGNATAPPGAAAAAGVKLP